MSAMLALEIDCLLRAVAVAACDRRSEEEKQRQASEMARERGIRSMQKVRAKRYAIILKALDRQMGTIALVEKVGTTRPVLIRDLEQMAAAGQVKCIEIKGRLEWVAP